MVFMYSLWAQYSDKTFRHRLLLHNNTRDFRVPLLDFIFSYTL